MDMMEEMVGELVKEMASNNDNIFTISPTSSPAGNEHVFFDTKASNKKNSNYFTDVHFSR